jgi:hypothetical protein
VGFRPLRDRDMPGRVGQALHTGEAPDEGRIRRAWDQCVDADTASSPTTRVLARRSRAQATSSSSSSRNWSAELRRKTAAATACSTVHGFAKLALEEKFGSVRSEAGLREVMKTLNRVLNYLWPASDAHR